MEIILYKLQNHSNSVKKAKTLDDATSIKLQLDGTLRSGTSIENPIITIEKSITQIVQYNYAYVSDFERYYFIDNKLIERNNLTTLYLKVDVLTSFVKNQYLQGFVARSSNSNLYDLSINDNNIQFSNKLTVFERVPETSDPNNEINTVFTSDVTYNVVINALNGVINDGGVNFMNDTITIPNFMIADFTTPSWWYTYQERVNGNIKNYKLRTCVGNFYYVTKSDDLANLYLASLSTQSVADSIKNIIAYPFEVPHGNTTCKFKDYKGDQYGTDLYATAMSRAQFLITEKFWLYDASIPTIIKDEFGKNNTYLKIELYIPYYGWIDIDSSSFNDFIYIFYTVDYSSGAAQVFVYNSSKRKLEFQGSCQLGIKLSITASNQEEINRRSEANNLNMGVGLVAAGVQVAIGAQTSNPYAIGRGITGAAATVTNYISNQAGLIVKANATVADSGLSFFGPQRARMRFSYNEPLQQRDSSYKKHIGIPTNKYSSVHLYVDSNTENYFEIINIDDEWQYNNTTMTKNEEQELRKICAEGFYW